MGECYLDVFREARRDTPALRASMRGAKAAGPGVGAAAAGLSGPIGERHGELPPLVLGHLSRLLDSTGIAQHASHAVADRAHGYCLDDNARGLMLATILPGGAGQAAIAEDLFARTAAFVQHAWNGEATRFRNFMGYDRHWLDEVGSEDSHARAVWALGGVVRHARDPATGPGPMACSNNRSRRCRASLPRGPGRSPCSVCRLPDGAAGRSALRGFSRTLANRLRDHLRSNRRPDWIWFEDVLSYDNARLAQAVVAAGHQAERADWQREGLEALDWLCEAQTADWVISGRSARTGSGGAAVHGPRSTSSRSRRVPPWRPALRRGVPRTACAG